MIALLGAAISKIVSVCRGATANPEAIHIAGIAT